jgi:hypothetical protein
VSSDSRRASAIDTLSRRRLSLAVAPSIPEAGAFRRATSKRWCSTVCARSSRLLRKSVPPSRRSALTPRPNEPCLTDRQSWRSAGPSLHRSGFANSCDPWSTRTAIVSSVMPCAPPKPTGSVEPFVLSIAASLRRGGKGVRLVIGNGAANAIDDGLASLIARAIATRNMFLAGRDDSVDAMASRLGVRRRRCAPASSMYLVIKRTAWEPSSCAPIGIEPISRSVCPFCHGERGAVGRSRMPMARSRPMKREL